MAAATKLKAKYTAATSNAASLISLIEGGKPYDWADNPQNKGKLVAELAKLKGRMDQFASIFLVTDPVELKRKYAHDYLIVELQNFMKHTDAIDEVDNQIKRLVKMTTNHEG